MSAPHTVRLPLFEGPLDLLLHLIKKNEVEITDIPISTITDQYLAMLTEHPELNLDGAGEYLVMAATLVYIKSRMLLPGTDDEEGADEDPRAELAQQLAEYQRFREVAVALGERNVLARDVFAPPGEPYEASADDEAGPPVRDASLGDLIGALTEVLQRIRRPVPHEVLDEAMSVRACVERILGHFALADEVEFTNLFGPAPLASEVIVIFLSLLELIRMRVVRARQPEQFGPITLALSMSLEDAAERLRDLGGVDEWRGGGGRHGDDGAAGDQ
jgi:segregation and condensation protein A